MSDPVPAMMIRAVELYTKHQALPPDAKTRATLMFRDGSWVATVGISQYVGFRNTGSTPEAAFRALLEELER